MVRVITASTNNPQNTNRTFTATPSKANAETTFSPNQVLLLLQSIKELEGLQLDYEVRKDGCINFIIGNIVYEGINLAEH